MTWLVTRDDYRWKKLEQVFNDCVKQYERHFSSYKPYTITCIDEYNKDYHNTTAYVFQCKVGSSDLVINIAEIRISDTVLANYDQLNVSFEQKDSFLFVAKMVGVGEKALLEV